eukprot:8420583-Ditylum_brightwellii.AAC.1
MMSYEGVSKGYFNFCTNPKSRKFEEDSMEGSRLKMDYQFLYALTDGYQQEPTKALLEFLSYFASSETDQETWQEAVAQNGGSLILKIDEEALSLLHSTRYLKLFILSKDNKDNWIDLQDKYKDIDAIEVDIFAWTETNVTWAQQLQTIAKQHARNQFKQAKLALISTDKASSSKYQMGGTMVGTVGRTTGRVIETDTDPRGMG